MPDLPKYEDWKAPWEEKGEELDAETAKKLIYNLSKDKENAAKKVAEKDTKIAELTTSNTELQSKVDEHETKNLSEVDRLKRENEQLKKKAEDKPAGPEFDLEKERLRIAVAKRLTESQAKRLVGETREELEADADAYMQEHGLSGTDDGGSNGSGRPGQRPVARGQFRTGNDDRGDAPDETDPAKLQSQLPPRR
jgi:actin-related protein